MSLGRLQNPLRNRAAALAAGAAFASVLAATGDAGATGPVEVTGKGIVGGGLLGAEVVTITMGAIGVEKGWPYFVFGGVGMIGGGIGGYFVEKATAVTVTGTTQSGGPAEPALYMLAGGMALVIPALIVSLNATAYKPPDSDRNEPANNEPAKEAPKPAPGPSPGAAPPPADAPAPGGTAHNTYQYRSRFRGELAGLPGGLPGGLPHIPVSLLDAYKGKLGLGVPAVEVRPLYTQREMWTYGVGQGTEVRLPLFKAMF